MNLLPPSSYQKSKLFKKMTVHIWGKEERNWTMNGPVGDVGEKGSKETGLQTEQ
jgi:hypothetical protein